MKKIEELYEVDYDSTAFASYLSFFINITGSTDFIKENIIANNTILYNHNFITFAAASDHFIHSFLVRSLYA